MVLVVRSQQGGDPISEEDIKQHVRQYAESGKISKWGVPDKVNFVEEIAKTSVGKIDKKLLREQHAGT